VRLLALNLAVAFVAIGAGDALLERAARLLAPRMSSTWHDDECSSSLRLGSGKLGCGYAVVDWLNRHPARGDVLDTWSKWLDPTVAYYLRRRHLVSIPSPPDRAQYRQALALAGVRFYYIRAGTRARWEGTTDPIMRRWVRTRLSLDRAAASWSKVIYRRGDCELRKII
jgi:hypothetical protein